MPARAGVQAPRNLAVPARIQRRVRPDGRTHDPFLWNAWMPFRNVSEKSDAPAQAQPSDSGWLRRWWPVPAVALLVLLSAATWRLTKADTATAPAASKGQRGPDAANRPTPVAAQPATIQPSFELMLGALGTVIPRVERDCIARDHRAQRAEHH